MDLTNGRRRRILSTGRERDDDAERPYEWPSLPRVRQTRSPLTQTQLVASPADAHVIPPALPSPHRADVIARFDDP